MDNKSCCGGHCNRHLCCWVKLAVIAAVAFALGFLIHGCGCKCGDDTCARRDAQQQPYKTPTRSRTLQK
ncbi:MAG: hypothetical protein LBB38_01965 [Puniceicoccales bacterium]|nr:hypothetical protein [Puniceicoccales bacterium]